MKRREFITLVGGAAAWPVVAQAVQPSSLPTVGFLITASLDAARRPLTAFNRGLADLGYFEGQTFVAEYRYADFHYDRLPALVDELIRRQVAVIIVGTTAALLAAKSATTSVPIVFSIGSDPVESGFVASLSRPGGSITGIFTLLVPLAVKRLELLRELAPSATTFAFVANSSSPTLAEAETKEIRIGERTLDVHLLMLDARNREEFELAFEMARRERAGGLVISSDSLFINSPDQLVELAARYQLPVIYADDMAAKNGGLISYGADQDDAYRLVGQSAGRVLKGEKPVDMPVQQSTKTRLVINLKTAKTLGLTVPEALLARADEVIE
jgi:putative ABC transport system substrate-binding protein